MSLLATASVCSRSAYPACVHARTGALSPPGRQPGAAGLVETPTARPCSEPGSACRPTGSQLLSVPGMRSQLTQQGSQLTLSVPPSSLLNADNAGQAGFALAWNGASKADDLSSADSSWTRGKAEPLQAAGAIATWTLGVLSAGSVVGALFSLPFWFAGGLLAAVVRLAFPHSACAWTIHVHAGAKLAGDSFGSALAGEELYIGAKEWSLTRISVLPRVRGALQTARCTWLLLCTIVL